MSFKLGSKFKVRDTFPVEPVQGQFGVITQVRDGSYPYVGTTKTGTWYFMESELEAIEEPQPEASLYRVTVTTPDKSKPKDCYVLSEAFYKANSIDEADGRDLEKHGSFYDAMRLAEAEFDRKVEYVPVSQ